MLTTKELTRFKSKIKTNELNGCQEWQGTISPNGYGVFSLRRSPVRAHRLSFTLENGDIPEGIFVCHKCDNRRCVNPEHLFLGTVQENTRDMDNKKRRAVGSKCNRSELSEFQVAEILASNLPQRTLARIYGVKHQTIGKIKLRQIWKHVDPTSEANET